MAKDLNLDIFSNFVPAMLAMSAEKSGNDYVTGLPYWLEHSVRDDGYGIKENEIKFDTRFFRMCPEWNRAERLVFIEGIIERASPTTRQPTPGWGFAPGTEPKYNEDETAGCRIKIWNATCDPGHLTDRHFVGEFKIDLTTYKDQFAAFLSGIDKWINGKKSNRIDATKAEVHTMLEDSHDSVAAFVAYVIGLHDEIMDAIIQYEGRDQAAA